MAGGISSAGLREVDGLCTYCGQRVRVDLQEWTGGPSGFTAHVECWGCDMRGPASSFVYETQDEAATNAIALWRCDPEAIAELRAK